MKSCLLPARSKLPWVRIRTCYAFGHHGSGDSWHIVGMWIPLLPRQVRVRQGAYLPHWTLEGATYHVVFRLGDSLPAQVVARYRAEKDAFSSSAKQCGLSPDELAARIRKIFSQ